jgi:hypothetical protein
MREVIAELAVRERGRFFVPKTHIVSFSSARTKAIQTEESK